jgi:hypothetical protein
VKATGAGGPGSSSPGVSLVREAGVGGLVSLQLELDGLADVGRDAQAEFGRRLAQVAAWLNERHPAVIEECRGRGIHLELRIEIPIDSIRGCQSPCFGLGLTADFLLACGRAGIPVKVFQEG